MLCVKTCRGLHDNADCLRQASHERYVATEDQEIRYLLVHTYTAHVVLLELFCFWLTWRLAMKVCFSCSCWGLALVSWLAAVNWRLRHSFSL